MDETKNVLNVEEEMVLLNDSIIKVFNENPLPISIKSMILTNIAKQAEEESSSLLSKARQNLIDRYSNNGDEGEPEPPMPEDDESAIDDVDK